MEQNEITMGMVENLRKELEKERMKNRNLSNQARRLGEALDAAIRAGDDLVESDMIGIVNANSENRKAREENAKARKERAAKARAYDKKLGQSYMRACKINAAVLVSCIGLAGCTIFLGHTGVISPELATGLSAVFLPLTGWAARDCAILFQFAGSIRW